jgi:hypothetical protein
MGAGFAKPIGLGQWILAAGPSPAAPTRNTICVEPVCVVSCFHPCRLLPLLSVYLLQRLVNGKVEWRDDGLGDQLLAFQVAMLQLELTLLARLG